MTDRWRRQETTALLTHVSKSLNGCNLTLRFSFLRRWDLDWLLQIPNQNKVREPMWGKDRGLGQRLVLILWKDFLVCWIRPRQGTDDNNSDDDTPDLDTSGMRGATSIPPAEEDPGPPSDSDPSSGDEDNDDSDNDSGSLVAEDPTNQVSVIKEDLVQDLTLVPFQFFPLGPKNYGTHLHPRVR